MGLLAANAEFWAVLGTTIAIVLALAPGILYAWIVLETWIDDDKSYAHVTDEVYKH
jgi:hypothetical protein